jgi:sulfite reductase beta subunit-like hemoprotein
MSSGPLAFADTRDIDEFVEGLRKYEAGEWTADQFRVFRLARGTYGQRQPDVQMLRVKIPQGVLDRAQLERLADVAERFSRGFGHITTRQNVQLHFVKLDRAAEAMHVLAESGLTTKEACGNTVRNVTGCPRAGVCDGEPFDVTPFAQAVTRHFLRRAENQALPRKFKIAFSGCADDCALGAINDVGAIAAVKDGKNGFVVKVAGGLSTTPEDAHTLFEFLPAGELIPAIEAILAVFDKHGNRTNKSRARLKYVVRKVGWEKFRALFDEEHAKTQREVPIADDDRLRRPPVRLPVIGGTRHDALEKWQATNVQRQKQPGFAMVTVRLVRGDITGAQLRTVGALAEKYGDGMVRLTIDQNLMLRFVAGDAIPALHAELVAAGLASPDAHTIADVTSCPGADSCNLAVTGSRELASALTESLEGGAIARDVAIKISGCPNSCGQHHIAGIGFHGGMRRVGGKVVPEYTLHLGGGVDGGGATFGRQVVKLPARRVPEALRRLLALYDTKKQDGEGAVAFFRRLPDAEVKALVADLTKMDADAPAEDFRDLGSEIAFMVETGEGECAV